MALRRYQHKFLQPLEIDQERVASSLNTDITTTNLTVTNSTVTNQTVSKLSTNNFFNSATPDYTPSFEALTILGDPNVSQGAIAHIRNNNVSVNDANVFGGLKFSSSPGADFIIGKSTQSGSGFLQVRRENGTTLLTLDGSGNFGIGITPSSKLHVFGSAWSNSAGGDVIITNSSSVGSSITLRPASSTNYSAGWSLYAGSTSSSIGDGSIGFWNHSSALDYPFYVRQNNDVVVQSGNIIIGTSGKGIDFSSTADGGTGISELFNDYEVGSWNPAVNRTTTSPTVSYTVRNGSYVKIGRMVTAFFDITASSVSGGSGNCIISGLPYVVRNGMGGYSVIHWRDTNLIPAGAANTQLKGYAEQSNSYIVIQLDNSGASGFGSTGNVTSYNPSGRLTGYITYEA